MEYTTKDSGVRQEYSSGMVRDTEAGKPRFSLMLPLGVPYNKQFLTRCAELLGRGADKYDSRNWEKADSEAELERYKSSAYRHFIQWASGEVDEDHAAAVFFNLLAHETLKYKLEKANSCPPVSEPKDTPPRVTPPKLNYIGEGPDKEISWWARPGESDDI